MSRAEISGRKEIHLCKCSTRRIKSLKKKLLQNVKFAALEWKSNEK